MNNACPLCGRGDAEQETAETARPRESLQHRWNCKTCGRFRTTDVSDQQLRTERDLELRRFLLSAYAKESPDLLIDSNLVERLRQGILREKTVPEKMELVLRHFAKASHEYGKKVIHDPENDYPIGWCRGKDEWASIIIMLVQDRGFLKGFGKGHSVTLDGWEWLEEKPGEAGRTAFVAMNFADRYRDLQEAITAAIDRAGYDPKVLNEDLFAGGIMDRVLARIREARFVVADYTENRGGVYYEAGFALGLGKTVIHSCNKEMLDPSNQKDRLHFDVAHLKVIPWNEGDLSTYSADLENHILAVFGRGPVKPQPLP